VGSHEGSPYIVSELLDGGTLRERRCVRLTDFGRRPTFITRRLSWSSDGRFVFAAVGEGDADVVLLDGLLP